MTLPQSSVVVVVAALVQVLLLLSLMTATMTTTTNAFTTTTTAAVSSSRRSINAGFCLGPVARNGMAYEDVTLGQGRRILPGDTVYCYYQGTFTTKSEGIFAKPSKTVVFDEISKCKIDSYYIR